MTTEEIEKLPPAEVTRLISELMRVYSDHFSEQFSVKIPKGIVKPVDFFRTEYFSFLKNSEYKSNISYLLQLIDFQIWLYRVFRPALSLENSYFYQLLVTMGIVAEGIVFAMLVDPLIKTNAEDHTLGSIGKEYEYLSRVIENAGFSENIERLKVLKVLSEDAANALHEFRKEVRNLVHLHSWEGRLYINLDLAFFMKQLKTFTGLLKKLSAEVKIETTPQTLQQQLFQNAPAPGVKGTGTVIDFFNEKGFGFIKSNLSRENIFFHSSQWQSNQRPEKGMQVSFTTQFNERKKTIDAAEVIPDVP